MLWDVPVNTHEAVNINAFAVVNSNLDLGEQIAVLDAHSSNKKSLEDEIADVRQKVEVLRGDVK